LIAPSPYAQHKADDTELKASAKPFDESDFVVAHGLHDA